MKILKILATRVNLIQDGLTPTVPEEKRFICGGLAHKKAN